MIHDGCGDDGGGGGGRIGGGGSSGLTLVVPGNADDSLIYQVMTTSDLPMPPSGLLDQTQTDVVKDWINAGAECGDVVSDTGASVDGGVSE